MMFEIILQPNQKYKLWFWGRLLEDVTTALSKQLDSNSARARAEELAPTTMVHAKPHYWELVDVSFHVSSHR